MTAAARPTVILAADVAGYASLIGTMGEGALERLGAHRREFVDPKLAQHNGRIVRATGERLLAEFASPAEAVKCAVDVQRGIINRNLDVPPDQRITYRVGIGMGEVTASGGDLVSRAVAALPLRELATLIKPGTEIYGDGVNIAVLVAALADPGGICISDRVWDAIRDELPYVFEDIGKQKLDMRAEPVHCYRLSAEAAAAKPYFAAQNRRHSASSWMGMRSTAVAAGLFATIGIWAVALWAWLGATSPTAPIPVSVGSQMPSVSSSADDETRARSSQPAPVTNPADAGTQAPVGPQPSLAGNMAADNAHQTTSGVQTPVASNTAQEGSVPRSAAQPASPDIISVVVRGRQALATTETTPEDSSAAGKDVQGPPPLQPTPNSVTAVVRGNQGEGALQSAPDIGTAVIRGNQAPSTPQKAPETGADIVRGTRAPSKG